MKAKIYLFLSLFFLFPLAILAQEDGKVKSKYQWGVATAFMAQRDAIYQICPMAELYNDKLSFSVGPTLTADNLYLNVLSGAQFNLKYFPNSRQGRVVDFYFLENINYYQNEIDVDRYDRIKQISINSGCGFDTKFLKKFYLSLYGGIGISFIERNYSIGIINLQGNQTGEYYTHSSELFDTPFASFMLSLSLGYRFNSSSD